jgi:sugar phosphate isomerase/epimerase
MNFKLNIGLKLYSTDTSLIDNALRIQEEGFYDYIELYIIPGSYKQAISDWMLFNVPFIIHAPHSFHGINLAQANMWKANQRNFKEAQLFADSLGADIIIVHGGNNGSLVETLRQIVLLDEKRIALENKPKFGLKNEVCIGWSPSEFRQAVDAGFPNAFVLDFVHAICAANSLDVDVMVIINEFMKFKPRIFHLSDGDNSSEKDIHLNLGKGSLDLAGFLSFVPEGALLTIETPRNPSNGLEDFVNDICFLRNILSRKESIYKS